MPPRIEPLAAPYEAAEAAQLAAMMPAGHPPIALFRTFVKNLPMTQAMHAWGGYELSKELSISLREREIVIDRTCARTGCEYEWGVHIAVFAARARLDSEQVRSLTHGSADDACWPDERERLLIRMVDELHAANDLSDALWHQLAAQFTDPQLLDLLLLCGWYHAISFLARAARTPLEHDAPTFASVQ